MDYISSDLHFDHKNIIKYSPDTRGFLNDVDEMNEYIVKTFNQIVSDDDRLYLLGDIGFGSPERTMDFLKRLNGEKVIIHGNHDRKLVASSIFQQPSQRRLAGIVEDTPYKVISKTVPNGKYGVVLFHFRIANWDGAHHGSIHLHGHEHGNGPQSTTRCMDIGVDTVIGMMPYKLDTVVEKLAKRPMHYEGHHDGTRE